MRKTKLLSLLLAAALLFGLLAACGTETPPATSPTATPPATASTAPSVAPPTENQDPVTLTWALWDWDATVYYQPYIDAYTATHPWVTIEPIDLGSADFMTNLSTQLIGGTDLDILTIKDIPGYGNLIKQGQLEPLSGYAASAGIDTSVYGGIVEQLTLDGEFYALPFRNDFWVTFYNKDLFDAANVPYPSNDMTFEQYDALARQVTNGEGASKVYGAHYHTWRSAASLFSILDGKNTMLSGVYDFMKPTYEMVLKQQDDKIAMDYASLKTQGLHYSAAFYSNQIAMLNMGVWFVPTQIAKVKDGESLASNWGIVKYPHPAGVPAGTTLATLTSLAVNKNSDSKDAALDFLNFVTSAEGAAVLAGTGNFPAITNDTIVDILANIEGFPTDAASKEALYVTKSYLELPLSDKAADINTVLDEEHAAIMTGEKSIDDGIASMNSRIGQILG